VYVYLSEFVYTAKCTFIIKKKYEEREREKIVEF